MKLAPWILASRPKTLLASASPVAIGSALAWHDGAFHWGGMLAALLGAMSIQIGTNFCNDYFDFFQGADTTDRKGPTRAVAAGLISPRAMAIATGMMFTITLAITGYLYARAGWPFLVIGLLSIVFGVMYTAGRFSLAYLGLGDPFVLIFFGPVAVTGTYYVQALQLDGRVAIAGIAPGLIAVGLLIVNNLRDIQEDQLANKRTLAVRFGAKFSRIQYVVCMVVTVSIPFVLWMLDYPPGVLIAALVGLPAALVVRFIWTRNGVDLKPGLGMTAGLLLLYTVLFCVGLQIII